MTASHVPLTARCAARLLQTRNLRQAGGPHRAKFLAPISGVVTAVNPRVINDGKLANSDPYSDGWVVRVHSNTLRQDLKNLMIGTETSVFLEKEVDHLFRMIGDKTGSLATDGGYMGNDIYGNMPQMGWDRLTRRFLHT